MTDALPPVSVVIPAFNCSSTLEKCLDSLARLDYAHVEIVIVDDGSTDRTAEILKQRSDIVVVTTENRGPSHARNVGASRAKGSFIAFTDSDCLVDERWISELVHPLLDTPDAAAAGGDQRSPDDDDDFGKRVHRFMKCLSFGCDYVKNAGTIVATRHNPTCNVMYRREALEQIGGFDEALWPGEDVDLDIRLAENGARFLYNPAAVVHHYRPSNLRGFARMMRCYGWAQGYLVGKHGFRRPLQYLPFVCAGMLAVFVALLILHPWAALALAALGTAASSLYLASRTRRPTDLVPLTVLLFVLLTQWNLGFFSGWPNPTARRE